MAKRSQRVNQVVEVVDEPVKEEIQEQPVVEEVVEQPETPVEKREEEKQKEEVADLYQPEIAEVKSNGSSKKLFVWAAIVVSVALLVGGGLVAVTRGSFSVPFVAQPSPTPTPTPTPTPQVTLDRKDLTIEVLNGGGTPGAAGKMKTLLEEKGYTVTSVGNTDQYTYEQTEIRVKLGKEGYVTLLEDDLKGDYTIGSTSATLNEDASSDAQVIVGKK